MAHFKVWCTFFTNVVFSMSDCASLMITTFFSLDLKLRPLDHEASVLIRLAINVGVESYGA